MDYSAQIAAVREADPAFGPVIDRAPAPASLTRPFDSAFEPLVRSIVYQQLSGKAAATIFGRFCAAFGSGDRPDPAAVIDAGEAGLREVGLSRQKSRYVLGLAEAWKTGALPGRAELDGMDDESVIECLASFKGIGRWTAEMVLMFWMGRPDVLPADDLGIRKGLQLLDSLEEMPAPEKVLVRGEQWRPYRTFASWYLWRAQE